MSTDFDRLTSNDVEMSSTNQNQAEKRAHHNALERKRRDHIKGSFGELRDVIPLLKGEKASRAHILKSATEYIRTMKPKNHEHQRRITELKRQNALLESQIRFLERMKETSLFTRNHQNESSHDGIQTTRNLLNYSTI